MSVWEDVVAENFVDGILGGDIGFIVAIVFILGLSAYGLIKSRKIFKEI